MKTTLQLILIGLLIMCFSSCYTQKKAQEQVNKANDKYPEIVGKLARNLYPCTDLLKPDTLIVYGDTLVWVECPDTATQIISFVDTLVKSTPGSTRTVRVPVTLPVQVKYITKWYEDSAKIKLAALEYGIAQKKIIELQQKLDSMTASRKWYRKWFWILIFIAGGLTVWTVRKIFI